MHPQSMIAGAVLNFQMKPKQRVIFPQAERQAERLLRFIRAAAVSPVQRGAGAKRALLDTDGRRAGHRIPDLCAEFRRKQVRIADIHFVGEEIQPSICCTAAFVFYIQRSVWLNGNLQIFVFQRLKANNRTLRQRQRNERRTAV